MNKKNFFKIFEPNTQLIFLVLAVFTVVSFFLHKTVFWVELVVFLVLLVYYTLTSNTRRKTLSRYIETLNYHVDSAAKNSLLNFPLPMIVVRLNGEISWYNDKTSDILNLDDFLLGRKVGDLLPGVDFPAILKGEAPLPIPFTENGHDFEIYYTVINPSNKNNGLISLYLVDRSEESELRAALAARTSVTGILLVDNYDEILQNVKEVEKANFTAQIDELASAFAEQYHAMILRFSRDRYLFIMEEPELKTLIADRFPILEKVKQIVVGPNNIPATISLGIGQGGDNSLAERLEFAKAAIDVSLGRGGDQAVIKTENNFEFYGGASKELEKRTRVKSRVMATALRELISDSDRVFIMGHRVGDPDSLGAAVGLIRATQNLGKQGFIVWGVKTATVTKMIDKLTELPQYSGVFVTPSTAAELCGHDDLLIVVDTGNPDTVEAPNLLPLCHHVVLIDHHRRGASYIEKTSLNFHEPFASSTSEMVTQVLQYLEEDGKLLKEEANALLAGIILDTKSFVQKTGVRTFEAASYLKRMGADPAEAKSFFASDLHTYILRTQFVSDAQLICPGIALATWNDDEHAINTEIVASGVDELLSIDGIKAAFGIAMIGDHVHISGRSYGGVNVQYILEKLGGGGHQTVAGAQLPEISVEKARQMLISVVLDNVAVEDGNPVSK